MTVPGTRKIAGSAIRIGEGEDLQPDLLDQTRQRDVRRQGERDADQKQAAENHQRFHEHRDDDQGEQTRELDPRIEPLQQPVAPSEVVGVERMVHGAHEAAGEPVEEGAVMSTTAADGGRLAHALFFLAPRRSAQALRSRDFGTRPRSQDRATKISTMRPAPMIADMM